MNMLVKSLPNVRWSRLYNMAYINNSSINVNLIFETFRGIAWIDGNYFFRNKALNNNNLPISGSTLKFLPKEIPASKFTKS